MSRTAPDPVFAAAARAEVERRMRGTADAALRRSRRGHWLMELAAIAGVTAIAAGIAVGVVALRPTSDVGGAPAGTATRSAAPSATAVAPPATSPAPPSATPTGAPSAPATTSSPALRRSPAPR